MHKRKKRKEGLSNKVYKIYCYTQTYVLINYMKLKGAFFFTLGFLIFKLPYYHSLNSKIFNGMDLLM